MIKTILLPIEINTDPIPLQLYGIRPEFTDRDWHEPRFNIGTDGVIEHGCLDATVRIPAGSCWKYTHSKFEDNTHRTAVYETVCDRP